MFAEMPETSSQNTWMAGQTLTFCPAIYHHVDLKKSRKQTNARLVHVS